MATTINRGNESGKKGRREPVAIHQAVPCTLLLSGPPPLPPSLAMVKHFLHFLSFSYVYKNAEKKIGWAKKKK